MYVPKPVVLEDTPDLPAILRLPAAEFELRASRPMLLATQRTANRHAVTREPVDAFKVKNYRTLSAIEIVNVQAAAHLFRDDAPTIMGSGKTVWPSLCAAMGDWMERFVADRVNTAVGLAEILNTCMKRNDSIVYIGFNLKVKRAYCGMVHERRPHERLEEHWRPVLQHSASIMSENELKCEYMARHRGTASWRFPLYTSCMQVIDWHRLQALEQRMIGLYPNSLNRMRHPSSLYRSVPKGGQSPVTVDFESDVHGARRLKPGNRRVETSVQMADADAAVLCGVDL